MSADYDEDDMVKVAVGRARKRKFPTASSIGPAPKSRTRRPAAEAAPRVLGLIARGEA